MDINRKDAGVQHSLSPLRQEPYETNSNHKQVHICKCKMSIRSPRLYEISRSYNVTISGMQKDMHKRSDFIGCTGVASKQLPTPIREATVRKSDSTANIKVGSLKQTFESFNNKQDSFYKAHNKEPTLMAADVEVRKPNSAENSITNLRELQELLCRIFRGENLSISDFGLRTPELHILVEIFIRKNRSACQSRFSKKSRKRNYC